jgi:His-Xaa-Ser system protein HxsD
MISIRQIDERNIEIVVDTSIYDDWVIEKVLYWWTVDYIIGRENQLSNHRQIVTLTIKDSHKRIDFKAVQDKISNDFIDYKNRQTISRETANIRDLLFAKAFANSDDFVEFTFKD